MTYCPCVMLCDLTTCYSIESARFQRLKLTSDILLSNHGLMFSLRRYTKATDSTFAQKMSTELKENPRYSRDKLDENVFHVNHYAGNVNYDVTVGPGGYRSPCHRMPFNSRNEGPHAHRAKQLLLATHRMLFNSRNEGSKCVR